MSILADIRIVAEHELDTWDAFVGNAPHGSLYHTSTWKKVIAAGYPDGEFQLIAAWQDGQIVAGFCALIRSRLGVLTAVTPLLTPYCGLLISAGPTDSDILKKLILYCHKFRYQKLQLAPNTENSNLLAEAGYTLIKRRTLLLNLRLPEQELWESFAGNVRRNIHKAEKAGFEITDQWDATAAYGIFSETFKRQGGRCPVSPALFNSIAESHILAENRRRYAAWKDGQLQAYIVALRYNGTVYYQLAASTDLARSAGISSLLIWELLREHSADEYQHFDFLGGNSPSITRFKDGFHPEEQSHLAAELCLSTRLKIGRAMRNWITRR